MVVWKFLLFDNPDTFYSYLFNRFVVSEGKISDFINDIYIAGNLTKSSIVRGKRGGVLKKDKEL